MNKLNVLCAALLMATSLLSLKSMEPASEENTPKNERLKVKLVSVISDHTDALFKSWLYTEYIFSTRVFPSWATGEISGNLQDIHGFFQKELEHINTLHKVTPVYPRLGIIFCKVSHDLTESALKELHLKHLQKMPSLHSIWKNLSLSEQNKSFEILGDIMKTTPVAIPIEYLIGKKPHDIIMFQGKAKPESTHGSTIPQMPWLQTKILCSLQEDDPDFLESPYTEFVATQEFCEEVNKLMATTTNRYYVGNLLINGKPLMDIK